MQGRVCAYCGCDLPRSDRGDVEHFRPKKQVREDPEHGGYWWLAYKLDNLLLSCSLCNRVYKRSRFPMRPGAKRVRFSDRSRIAREARLLLEPTIDPVEDWLDVTWRRELCRLVPRSTLTRIQKLQVTGTIELLKLNHPDLLRERNQRRKKVQAALDQNRGKEAGRLAIRYRPHSLVAVRMLENRAPEALPTPAEESRWLLAKIFERLAITQRELGSAPDGVLRRAVDELLWSYAVLWHDSPAGTDAVRRYLRAQGIDGYLGKYLAQL